MGFEELTCPSGASARHRCVLVGCQYGARMDPEVSTKSTTRWPVAVGAVVLAWLLWVMARLAIAAGDGVVWCAQRFIPHPWSAHRLTG